MRFTTLQKTAIVLCALVCIVHAAVLPQKEDSNNAPLAPAAQSATTSHYKRFLHGFLASIYVIIISELGDKTFFIAAILSIDHPRLVVYAGAMFALATMTILSALMGYATEVLPRIYTFYLSGFLFLVFGVKMLRDGKRDSFTPTYL